LITFISCSLLLSKSRNVMCWLGHVKHYLSI
jgi:hypothetical protein